ncbi:MAG: deoxyribose-phosphate aldolase [Phycicoccus sp.]|uniref:Cgl0159 family (beta/alpha)8-fold protein n=1 Tax=Phycicoccus sp. TaxID=1902410 RepID=UPI00258A16E9|nr:deoxyribose-phosphate aldolase [Phycicoccus sp.]MCO5303290.1 deoxyribose-phosphate aldolase [Phycicoccus sp.]
MIDTTALTRTRIQDPGAIGCAWRNRTPGVWPKDGRLLIVAADHPARGALFVRGALRMASRSDLLDRLVTALARPGVDGVLASPDILDDLLLLGALEGKLVIGSMNRGGLQGASFELDDRFTGCDADTIAALGLDGGKMLTRICLADLGSAATRGERSRRDRPRRPRQTALSSPSSVRRDAGRVENLLDPDSVITSIAVASALGATSAHTWLKIPVVDDMERVLDATTLPTLLLGGDPSGSPDITYAAWQAALAIPPAAGLVVGRALLHPLDDDVAAAVDIAVSLVHGGPA